MIQTAVFEIIYYLGLIDCQTNAERANRRNQVEVFSYCQCTHYETFTISYFFRNCNIGTTFSSTFKVSGRK